MSYVKLKKYMNKSFKTLKDVDRAKTFYEKLKELRK